jgi:hypothetical protein
MKRQIFFPQNLEKTKPRFRKQQLYPKAWLFGNIIAQKKGGV